jgi:hypothetical protein
VLGHFVLMVKIQIECVIGFRIDSHTIKSGDLMVNAVI